MPPLQNQIGIRLYVVPSYWTINFLGTSIQICSPPTKCTICDNHVLAMRHKIHIKKLRFPLLQVTITLLGTSKVSSTYFLSSEKKKNTGFSMDLLISAIAFYNMMEYIVLHIACVLQKLNNLLASHELLLN